MQRYTLPYKILMESCDMRLGVAAWRNSKKLSKELQLGQKYATNQHPTSYKHHIVSIPNVGVQVHLRQVDMMVAANSV